MLCYRFPRRMALLPRTVLSKDLPPGTMAHDSLWITVLNCTCIEGD